MTSMTDFARRSDLSGRTAIVTGALGHIGRTICETLTELGATVVGTDRVDRGDRSGVVAEHFVPADLRSTGEIHKVVDTAETTTGGIDIVVHSAALVGTDDVPGWAVPFPEQSIETWRQALEINLTSAFTLCQRASPALTRSGHGSIVLISSIYGFLGQDPALYEGTSMASPAAYFASKGGLEQLSRWLASTLAPHVRCNTICPGGISRGQPEEFRERYERRTPLGRLGSEDDLRGAVAYLASDLSAYVTGQRIVVDGGLSATP